MRERGPNLLGKTCSLGFDEALPIGLIARPARYTPPGRTIKPVDNKTQLYSASYLGKQLLGIRSPCWVFSAARANRSTFVLQSVQRTIGTPEIGS